MAWAPCRSKGGRTAHTPQSRLSPCRCTATLYQQTRGLHNKGRARTVSAPAEPCIRRRPILAAGAGLAAGAILADAAGAMAGAIIGLPSALKPNMLWCTWLHVGLGAVPKPKNCARNRASQSVSLWHGMHTPVTPLGASGAVAPSGATATRPSFRRVQLDAVSPANLLWRLLLGYVSLWRKALHTLLLTPPNKEVQAAGHQQNADSTCDLPLLDNALQKTSSAPRLPVAAPQNM